MKLSQIIATMLVMAAVTAAQQPTRVWVNTRSGVYHCSGTRDYGSTQSGMYLTESEAVSRGYRPAHGKSCTAEPAGTLQTPQVPDEPPPAECGVARWPVKILADPDRGRVSPNVVDSTIRALGAKPRPHRLPYNRRVAPEELITYRLKARLVRVKQERDSDLHLLLADPDDASARMIAEIPHPGCAVDTGHQQEYRAARRIVRQLAPGTLVEVTGVAFFDFMHEQRGAAPNGIEIHPVQVVQALN
jgi:hypothetical protein